VLLLLVEREKRFVNCDLSPQPGRHGGVKITVVLRAELNELRVKMIHQFLPDRMESIPRGEIHHFPRDQIFMFASTLPPDTAVTFALIKVHGTALEKPSDAVVAFNETVASVIQDLLSFEAWIFTVAVPNA